MAARPTPPHAEWINKVYGIVSLYQLSGFFSFQDGAYLVLLQVAFVNEGHHSRYVDTRDGGTLFETHGRIELDAVRGWNDLGGGKATRRYENDAVTNVHIRNCAAPGFDHRCDIYSYLGNIIG